MTAAPDRVARTARTVAELLRARAQDQPDRLAYRFLEDGETDESRLTYAEADRRAGAVAARLRDAGVSPGARALLVLPPGLDYATAFFGCLHAGVVAVPVYPPDPFAMERTLPRLLAVVLDAEPVVALTTAPLLGYLDEVARHAPRLRELRWVAVDEAEADDGPGDRLPVDPGRTAFLQYTSGSTAAPRGVRLSHANLLHNSSLIQHVFGTQPDSQGLSWLPPYHDMGLIGGLLQPLYAGCPVTLMSPLHFLEQPMRWLTAVDRFRATISGAPNFAYELCARKADPEQVARLDLRSWRVAFNGAEPVRPRTLRRFADAFAPAGFRPEAFLPCYGLAEATLIVSGAGPVGAGGPVVVTVDREALRRDVAAPAGDGPAVHLTGCGRGAADQRIAIVDPVTGTRRPPGGVGEIWVGGPSVAEGYWGRPELTAQVFGARLTDPDDGPYLRTGDLGFLHDGELVVTGRLKDLIVVRGRNHYPQDIELTAERADPALRPGCAVAFLDGAERLVVVLEVRRDRPVDVDAVASRVREAVAREHGLQAHSVVLVHAGGVPKTSSGKVQRAECRERLRAGRLPEVGRRTATPDVPADPGPIAGADDVRAAPPGERAAPLDGYLRGRVAALTGIAPGDLDGAAPLLAAGLDSLAVLQLRQRVDHDLGVRLPLAPLMRGASLAEVVDQVAALLDGPVGPAGPRTAGPTGAPAPGTGPYEAPVSASQRWMWVLQHLEPDSTIYTLAVPLRVRGPLDHAALRRAVDSLVARHPALRTTFPLRDGVPVQLVHPTGRAGHGEHDARGRDAHELAALVAEAARRPFDLEHGPLLRLDVYRHDDGDILLLTMHHIITDFWSTTILARELAACYDAHRAGHDPALPPPRATFADVVGWQLGLLSDPATADDLTRFWDGQIGAGTRALALPAAARGGAARGGHHAFALPAALAARLRSRAAAERVTVHVLLLAAFQVALHGTTGQDDLAVGVSATGRTRHEFADVVGCCTNPVMVRVDLAADEPFRALLARTQGVVIDVLEHQDYPTIVLAQRHRAAHRGRLIYEALFTYNRSPDGSDLAAAASIGVAGMRRRLGSLEVETYPLPPGQSTRPLDLVLAEVDGTLHGLLRYGAGAFDPVTVRGFADRLVAVLEAVAADPCRPVGELARGPVPVRSA